MYHFFVDRRQVGEKEVSIQGSDVNHIKNVLRMRIGENIKVSDGANQVYQCAITEFSSDEVLAEILSVEESFVELPSKLYLFQGLPKSDKMELIIQKAVELGVYAVIPMVTNRAIVKLDARKEESKRKRWSAIAESAAKQSGRTIVPEILPVMSMKEAIAFTKDFQHKFIPYECAEGMEKTRELIAAVKPETQVAVFIGPEGGFEKEEVDRAMEAGIESVTLGRRILRTETAGMTMLSLLMFHLDR